MSTSAKLYWMGSYDHGGGLIHRVTGRYSPAPEMRSMVDGLHFHASGTVSANGRYVLIEGVSFVYDQEPGEGFSTADATDGLGERMVYTTLVWDRADDTVVKLSSSITDAEWTYNTVLGIMDDGRVLAYWSGDDNPHNGGPYLHDWRTNTFEPLLPPGDKINDGRGGEVWGEPRLLSLSEDDRYVLYEVDYDAVRYNPDGSVVDGLQKIFWMDRKTGQTRLVTDDPTAVGQISPNGLYGVFWVDEGGLWPVARAMEMRTGAVSYTGTLGGGALTNDGKSMIYQTTRPEHPQDSAHGVDFYRQRIGSDSVEWLSRHTITHPAADYDGAAIYWGGFADNGDTLLLSSTVPLTNGTRQYPQVKEPLGGSSVYRIPLFPGKPGYYATNGDDFLEAEDASGRVSGLGGDDVILGSAEDDTLYGNAGEDEINGRDGNDTIHGDNGDPNVGEADLLSGGAGEDLIHGDGGDDLIFGGEDNDRLFGDGGDDELHGDGGADFLFGGDGDDLLDGGAGNDVLDGGENSDKSPDFDRIELQGAPEDYTILDSVQDKAATTIESVVTGRDTVRNVEELWFDHQWSNVVVQDNMYVTLAIAANASYEASAHANSLIDQGWRALSSLELGIERSGVAGPGTVYTYTNGVYSAIDYTANATSGPLGREAAAHVYVGVVDGKNTLLLAVRGTDQAGDVIDYFPFQDHADRLKPLVDAILDYIAKGAYAKNGSIDQIYITGHSLGGATVQQIMHDPRIAGDPKWIGSTYGSPGSESFATDSRLLHFEHQRDPVPLAGDIGRFLLFGEQGAQAAQDLLALLPDWVREMKEVRGRAAVLSPFHVASDEVRINPYKPIASPDQHSMTNYIDSLVNMYQQRALLPFMERGPAAVPGELGTANVMVGSAASDTMVGSGEYLLKVLRGPASFDGAELIIGGGGADHITGGSGADTFAGTLADLNGDFIADLAGGEAILVSGAVLTRSEVSYRWNEAAGQGELTIGSSTVYLAGRHTGTFTVSPLANGTDSVIFYHGSVQVDGGNGDDDVAGGSGNDTLSGGGGDDVVTGGDGDDRLYGDYPGTRSVARTATAPGGRDILDGGKGADTYTGGDGSDLFVLGMDRPDRVTDMAGGAGGDLLDVTEAVVALDLNVDPFMTGHFILEADGAGGTRLMVDRDGSAGPARAELYATFDNIAPTDFTADNFFGGRTVIDPFEGQAAIRGTAGNDLLVGTAGDDLMIGLGGRDAMLGGDGNDRIYLGSRASGVIEAPGTDRQDVPAGHAGKGDVAYGGRGDDRLVAGDVDATLYGEDGNDVLSSGAAATRMYGGDGADLFLLTGGTLNQAWGGAGSDTFRLGRTTALVEDFAVAEDRIDLSSWAGVTSTAQLQLTQDGDCLRLSVGAGSDTGSIALRGMTANQIGTIRFVFGTGEQFGLTRLTAGDDTVRLPDRPLSMPMLRMDDGGQDTIHYGAAPGGGGLGTVAYFGGSLTGADRFAANERTGAVGKMTAIIQGDYTGAGALTLDAGKLTGLDRLVLLTGGDDRYGHAGAVGYDLTLSDAAQASFAALTIDASMLNAAEAFTLRGAGGTLHLHVNGSAGDNVLTGARNGTSDFAGGAGNDTLTGGNNADRIAGGSGADIINGGDGDDLLGGDTLLLDASAISLAAADVVDGGSGRDTLIASSGARLTGGADADRFVLSTTELSGVTITDFTVGTSGDVLDLTALRSAFGGLPLGGDALGRGYVRLRDSNDGLLVEVDPSLSGTFRTIATLTGVRSAALDHSNVAGLALPGVQESVDTALHFGTAGSDVFTGHDRAETFRLESGGHDRATGGGGNDGFFLGATLDVDDVFDGGSGGDDQLGLQGMYGSAGQTHVLGTGNLIDIETLALLSGTDTRFGATGTDRLSYWLSSVDANVAAGKRLLVTMNGTVAGEHVSFDGSPETDGSFLFYGGLGSETLTGGAGADGFYFGGGGRFGVGTVLAGGAGADQLGLQGSYTLTFTPGQLSGIETIVLLGGNDVRFGGSIEPCRYDLTWSAGNAAAGETITINGNTLAGAETLRFDGSREGGARFVIYGGAASDTLIGGMRDDELHGGAGSDVLRGGLGKDVLWGGAGSDTFVFGAAAESSGAGYDIILDFGAGDLIDLAGGAASYGWGGRVAGSVSTLSLDADLSRLLTGHLGAGQLAVVSVTSGDQSGNAFVVVDANGVAGYQAGEDLLIAVLGRSDLGIDGLTFIV